MAQVFDGPGRPMQLREFALPEQLGPGEVLVRVQLATLCGSDLHTIDGRRHEPTPAILGHEGVGTVLNCGAGRTDLIEGARVTWSIADACGTCAPCTVFDLPQKCDQLFKYGHATTADGHGLNGTYATHVILRRGTRIVPLPDALSDQIAVPANCALATVANILSHVPERSSSVLVQGAGLLGLYACAWLRDRGVEHVFCTDPLAARRQLSERFGATPLATVDENATQRLEQVRAVAPHGVDAVLELSGEPSVVPEAISHLRAGGVYVLAGMVHPASDLGGLTGEQIIRKCLTLRGVHNYGPHHLEQGVAFLQRTRGQLPYEDLVSPPVPLSRLSEAIELSAGRKWCRVSINSEEFC